MSRFYQFPWSPYCIKVWLVLRTLEVEFEEVLVEPRNRESLDALERATAVRSMPAYVTDDGEVLRDSSTIVEYLCHDHPKGHLYVPTRPLDALRARGWERFVGDHLMGPCTYIGFGSRLPAERRNEKRLASERERLDRALTTVEAHFVDRDYFVESGRSVADLALLTTVEALRWDGTVNDFSRWPELTRWWDRTKHDLPWGDLERSLARVKRAYE